MNPIPQIKDRGIHVTVLSYKHKLVVWWMILSQLAKTERHMQIFAHWLLLGITGGVVDECNTTNRRQRDRCDSVII